MLILQLESEFQCKPTVLLFAIAKSIYVKRVLYAQVYNWSQNYVCL